MADHHPSPVDPYQRQLDQPPRRSTMQVEKAAVASAAAKEFGEHPTEIGDGLLNGAPRRTKRFLCWRLPKRQWILALLGLVLGLVTIVLLVLFLAVVPRIFQSHADDVQMTVNYLDLKTLSSDPDARAADVELSLRLKYASSLTSRMDDAAATLYYDEKPFGTITIPAQTLEKGSHEYDLVIKDTAQITDVEVFARLSKSVVVDSSVAIEARAKVKAHALGLSYGGIRLNRQLAVKAINNFRDPAPVVNKMKLQACDPDAYKILINVTLTDASQVGLDGIGVLNMSIYYEQDYLGHARSLDGSRGIRRGPNDMAFELTVPREPTILKVLVKMLTGVLMKKAQFFIRGDNPYATKAVLLKSAVAALNMSVLYTDGMDKVELNPSCDLMALVTGGAR